MLLFGAQHSVTYSVNLNQKKIALKMRKANFHTNMCKVGKKRILIFQSFHKIRDSDEGNLENFENTSEINPYLHEGTLQLHDVHHIKDKIIEG